jgi:hypothetical protein
LNRLVRFEEEADAEYRAAARWYERRRAGLGAEFLDAVDTTLARIAQLPDAGAPVNGIPADLPVRRAPVTLSIPRDLPRGGRSDPRRGDCSRPKEA